MTVRLVPFLFTIQQESCHGEMVVFLWCFFIVVTNFAFRLLTLLPLGIPPPSVEPGQCLYACSGERGDCEQGLCLDRDLWQVAIHLFVRTGKGPSSRHQLVLGVRTRREALFRIASCPHTERHIYIYFSKDCFLLNIRPCTSFS